MNPSTKNQHLHFTKTQAQLTIRQTALEVQSESNPQSWNSKNEHHLLSHNQKATEFGLTVSFREMSLCQNYLSCQLVSLTQSCKWMTRFNPLWGSTPFLPSRVFHLTVKGAYFAQFSKDRSKWSQITTYTLQHRPKIKSTSTHKMWFRRTSVIKTILKALRLKVK